MTRGGVISDCLGHGITVPTLPHTTGGLGLIAEKLSVETQYFQGVTQGLESDNASFLVSLIKLIFMAEVGPNSGPPGR